MTKMAVVERNPAIQKHIPEIQRDKWWTPPPQAGKLFEHPLDTPPAVSASEAEDEMRDDDYVIATVHKGIARAYPTWVIDYYHTVNDVIEGDQLWFSH
jgi:hypothetical protein